MIKMKRLIVALLGPAKGGPSEGTGPGAPVYPGADQQHEEKRTQETAPEIPRFRDRVGEIIILGIVLDIPVKGNPHDRRTGQHHEDAAHAGIKGEDRGSIVKLFILERE